MTEKLQQKIKEEVMKLPKDKQDAINSFDWAKRVEEIGIKFLLSEEEINDLQVETLLVLIGLIDLDKYRRDIENDIGMSSDQADGLCNEVLDTVFMPITEKLESSVKDNLSLKKQDFSQTVKFILSGGDYSYFLDK